MTSASQNSTAVPVFNLSAIPAELIALPQWVCWRYETRKGKQTKPPIQAKSNGKLLYAESNNPATWSDFATAAAAAVRLNLEGIGLNVWENDGLAGLDLDHVIDPVTGALDPLAAEAVGRFSGTYAEISPSGTGIRIWCYGKPGRTGKVAGKVKWLEVYAHPSHRYLTVTGNHWAGSATTVTNQQDALDWLHSRFMGTGKNDSTGKKSLRPQSVDSLDDAALLHKARNAKNGAIFDALWRGDTSGYNDDHSSADLALLNILAFWTDRDAARVDRLFRQSGLMRDKWDVIHDPASGRTYGAMSIDKAIAYCREGYSGKKPSAESARPAGAPPSDDGDPGISDDDMPPFAAEAGDAVAHKRIGTFQIKAGEFPEAMDAAERFLLKADAGVFQRGYLCRVSHEPVPTVRGISRPVGTVLMIALTDAYLRNLLDRLVEWKRWDVRAEDWRRCNIPADVAKRLLENAGDWHFPVLTGVITAPTLRPDGSLLNTPGYDARTGLFFDPQGETFPAIPDRPSRMEGQAALAYLSREILENRCAGSDENTGFSFATPASKSAALSGLVTPLVRHTVPTAPLLLVNAPRPASGKSLLVDAAALLATGKTATILDLADDDDEQEKRLLAVFMSGDLVINLDNIERPLGGPHLCKALTAETFTGRILGLSKNATVPTTAAFFATGNNVIVKEDMTRRVVLCQLDPQTETPEKREYERNLLEWIPANRPALVMAALAALRAYIVAGKPKVPYPPMGSFEDWHRLVRSALIWLGEADPLGETSQMEDTDPARIKLRALMFAWHGRFKSIPTTCKEAVAKANATMRDENGDEVPADAILRDVLTDHFADRRKGGLSGADLGYFLRKNKGRIECGAKFEAAGKSRFKTELWCVKIVDAKNAGDAGLNAGDAGDAGDVSNEANFLSLSILENFTPIAQMQNNLHEKYHSDSFAPRGETSPASPASPAKSPKSSASLPVESDSDNGNWETF